MENHLESIERECRLGDIEYFRVMTDQPLENTLIDFVRGRR